MPSNTNFVCVPCRRAIRGALWPKRTQVCPTCAEAMVDAGPQVAIPRRLDRAKWRVLAAVLDAGVTFHSTCGCCGDGPGYRPRTLRALGDWRADRSET